MSDDFAGFTCWTPENIRTTIFPDLGALPTDAQSLVEAARVNIPLYRAGGNDQLLRMEDLLEDFEGSLAMKSQNSVFALSGPSGCGKTFVVKWVHEHLTKRDTEHVVYIPRNSVSLRRVLHLVLDGLPGEKAKRAREDLDAAADDNPAQIQRGNIHNALANVLTEIGRVRILSEHERALLGEPDDAHHIYRNGIGDLIRVAEWRTRLIAEGGVLDKRRVVLAGSSSIANDDQIRDAGIEFETADIPSADRRLAEHHPETRIIQALVSQPVFQPALLSLLNRALSAALPRVAGIKDASDVFDNVRAVLRESGKSLVLLFEDMAVAGGIEAEWYNEFRNHPTDTRCPLYVVFAATSGHFLKNVPEMVKTDLKGHYELRSPTADTEDGLRQGRELLANYFNLARLGRDEIDRAWQSSANKLTSDQSWVPIKCEDCRHRVVCHEEFGEVNGVGLYPLNSRAADLMLKRHQRENRIKYGGVGFTPRQIVNDSAQTWLQNVFVSLSTGTFPDAKVCEGFEIPHLARPNVLADLAEQSGNLADRVYEARRIWTDGKSHSLALSQAFALPNGVNTPCGVLGCERPAVQDNLCRSHLPELLCSVPNCGRNAGADQFCETHREVARVEWSNPQIVQWSEGKSGDTSTAMLEADVSFIRTTLKSLVDERVRFEDYFMMRGKNNLFLNFEIDKYLKESSFRVADSYGDQSSPGSFSHRFERSDESFHLLCAAYWFGKTSSWRRVGRVDGQEFESPDWVCVKGRGLLEEFVDRCAQDVELHLLRCVQRNLPAVVAARLTGGVLVGASPMNADPLVALSSALMSLDFPPDSWISNDFSTSAAELLGPLPLKILKWSACSRQGDGASSAVDIVSILNNVGVVHESLFSGNLQPIDADSLEAEVQLLLNRYNAALPSQLEQTSNVLEKARGALQSLGEDRDEWEIHIPRLREVVNDLVYLNVLREGVQSKRDLLTAAASLGSAFISGAQIENIDALTDVDKWRTARSLEGFHTWAGIISDIGALVDDINQAVADTLAQGLEVDPDAFQKQFVANLSGWIVELDPQGGHRG